MALDLFEEIRKAAEGVLGPQVSTDACGEEGPDLCGGGPLRDLLES